MMRQKICCVLCMYRLFCAREFCALELSICVVLQCGLMLCCALVVHLHCAVELFACLVLACAVDLRVGLCSDACAAAFWALLLCLCVVSGVPLLDALRVTLCAVLCFAPCVDFVCVVLCASAFGVSCELWVGL